MKNTTSVMLAKGAGKAIGQMSNAERKRNLETISNIKKAGLKGVISDAELKMMQGKPKESKSIYEMLTKKKNPAWADKIYNPKTGTTLPQDIINMVKKLRKK